MKDKVLNMSSINSGLHFSFSGDDEVEIETPVSTQEDDMESQAANKAAKKGKKGKKARKDEDL